MRDRKKKGKKEGRVRRSKKKREHKFRLSYKHFIKHLKNR